MILVIPCTANCQGAPVAVPGRQGTATKVLFVGNSLTFTNDMPEMFRNLAAASGKAVHVEQATIGGVDLRHLVSSPLVMNKVNEAEWDYVVLQSDDISAFPDMHPIEIDTLESFKEAIYRKNPASQIIYTMIWGLRDGVAVWELNGELVYYSYEEYFRKIYAGTLFIADAADLRIAPVGWAWCSAIADDPDNSMLLFSGDKAHPALQGSYLMACVMFASIFPDSTADIAFYSTIPVEKAKYCQKKAIFAREKFRCGLPSDSQDALALAQHLAGKPAALPCPGHCADIDGNGKLDAVDLVALVSQTTAEPTQPGPIRHALKQ